MYLILNEVEVILYITKEKPVINQGTDGLEVINVSSALSILNNNLEIVEVADVPKDIVIERYCYNAVDGFYKNPNFVEQYLTISDIIPVHEILDNALLTRAESELEIDERISKLELGLA